MKSQADLSNLNFNELCKAAMQSFPIYKPFISDKEKEYVNQCLDSTWISSKGEFINKFESHLGKYIGTNYVNSVCNGTVALHLALETLGIGSGDEVIVPSLTYVASVNTIIQVGAKPVFVDSCASTWQMDCDDIRQKITSNTKAIMAVHIYGVPCDMDQIVDICKQFDLLLIEDCAEAFGTTYKGKHVGTFGDMATFSFFGNKTITTGEGGAVISKNLELHERAYHLKTQGVSKTKEYWHDVVAYNYRMTNICAAIGVAQLEKVSEILKRKAAIHHHYSNFLSDLPIKMQKDQVNATSSYWMCSVLLESNSLKEGLREHLARKRIDTRSIFPPVHTMPHCFTNETFPIAEGLSACGINLPSYPSLSLDDIMYITKEIKNFMAISL